MYGSNTWTLTKSMEKSLDGCYTCMLCMVLNISWREHITNRELYGELPKLSERIREACLRIADHCMRHPEEETSKVVLWQPARGTTNRGRRHCTFIDNRKKDTGLESVSEIKTAMMDKTTWWELVNSAQENSWPR